VASLAPDSSSSELKRTSNRLMGEKNPVILSMFLSADNAPQRVIT